MQPQIQAETAIRSNCRATVPRVSFAQLARILLAEADGDRDEAAKKLKAMIAHNCVFPEIVREALIYACRHIMLEQGRLENASVRRSATPGATEFPMSKTRRGQFLDRLYDLQLYAAGTTLGEATHEQLLQQAELHSKLAHANHGAARGLRALAERLAKDRSRRVRDAWSIDEIRAVASKNDWNLD